MGRPPQLLRAGILLGCLLVLGVDAKADKCTVGCHGMHGGKGYQEGHTYVYDLEGTSVTSVAEAQGEATLKLKATVELTVKPDCIRQLRLKGVQVNGAPIALPDVEQKPIQFNYHDGHIDTEICTMPGDSQASLNIKRAVASMFQAAVMQDSGSTTHHETDIFGSCPTDFNFHRDGDSTIVQKYRDLSLCSHRENIKQGLVSASLDTEAGIKSSPLLASSQKIEQRFKKGVLNKAISTETYKYKPFSNGEAGAKTVVETTLVLKGESGDVPASEVSQPKSLVFEVPHPIVKSSIDAISNALKAVKSEHGVVKAEAASKFAELVKILRISSKNDILSVYHKVRAGAGFDKVSDKKILLDALFRAGSGEAAEVAVELIKNREIAGVQALLFYTSLALVQHVNLPAVTAVTSLLDQPDLPRIGYLGIGQVIGKYCQQHSCEDVPEIKEAIKKIRDKVGNGKTKTRQQENVIISALKALGNAKYLDDVTLQKLANIAADKSVRNRVRVAAIEALPSRCSMKWKNVMLKVLADREEDSEVRIKTYMSLVACACPHVANQLKEVLDKETVNQVGSFITSHLRNLRASTDPSKQEAKRQLGLIKPHTKFPEDFRKFSFNNELSYHIDAFGVGSTMESNVIYSQNSFVPRSTSLNISAEIFGHMLNFLELDTRVENLDRVIEHFFGPKGELADVDTEEIVEEGTETAKNIKERLQKFMRGKREVKQGELDKFAKNVRLRGTEVDQDLDIDLSMKLFGVELAYLSFQGDSSKLTVNKILDKFFNNLDKGLSSIKNFNYDIENHLLFLDAELVYPTGIGAPLSLGVTGTSVVHLKTKGKIDVNEIMKNPRNAAFTAGLDSSAAITVTGSLMQEICGVESGMKVVTTLHTSTGSDLTVKILNGKGIDVDLALPKKKQELITVNSEILMTSGAKGEKLVAPKFSKGKEHSDCFDQFSGLLGVTVCGQISYPYDNIESVQKKPFFPLSGPAKFSVTVENNDINSVHFKAFYDDTQPDAVSMEILLETPNSRTNRKVSLMLEAGLQPDKYARVSFESPVKSASIEGVLKNQPEEKTLTVRLRHDQNEYFARAGLLAEGSNYKPILEYHVPEHIEKLAGVKTGSKSQEYQVQGTVDVSDFQDGKKYGFNHVALVISGRKVVGLDGYITTTSNSAGMDMKVEYGEENLALKLDGKKLGTDNYALSLSAVPSRDPNVGFNLKWDYKRGPHDINNKLIFVHGPDPNSKTNRLTIEEEYHYKIQPEDLLLSGSYKVKYPVMNLLLDLEGKLTRNSLDAEFEIKYDKFKLGADLSTKRDMSKKGDYEIEFEAKLFENKLELKSKRTVLSPHKSKFENSLELSPGGKYKADGVVTHDVSKNNVNVQFDGQLDLNGKVVKVDTACQSNRQMINSHAYVTVGSTKYVEFSLVGRRDVNPSGEIHLNLKNYLTMNGQFKYQGGKGNGHIEIDIPKINRKIKGTGDITVAGTQHVGNLELLFDADKDPSKCIKISTNSDISKKSIDTKNIIEILSHRLEVNAKFNIDGEIEDGTVNAEAEITLPNGRYILYKGTRTATKKGDKKDMQVHAELIDHVTKGGQSRKLQYNADLKDYDRKTLSMQGKCQLKFINFDGKDIQGSLSYKHLLEGLDKRQYDIDLVVSGNLLDKPINLKLSGSHSKTEGNYDGSASLGDNLGIRANGMYKDEMDQNKPVMQEGVIELKLPSEKLHNLKIKHRDSLKIPQEVGGRLEYSTLVAIIVNNDDHKTLKVELDLNHEGIDEDLHKSQGSSKIFLVILDLPHLTINTDYKHDATGDLKKCSGNMNILYGEKETSVIVDSAYKLDMSEVMLNAKAKTPFEKMRSVGLQFDHKKEPADDIRKMNINAVVNDEKYSVVGEARQSLTSPMVHAVVTCPNGKNELLINIQKLGENDYKGEWKFITQQGFVEVDAHINLESLDNFVINFNFDSDKVKHRKIHAEIANRPTAKVGRRIIITVTSDGKNIVTGSTNYKKRDEEGKLIVEGNGNLKIGDNTRTSSFKYTRQELTRETDGEVGVAMVLNANFEPSAIVGELKLTNKEIHFFNSYCEQNKDCAHFKLQKILDSDQKTYLKHHLTMEVDLRKFNVPAAFGLKTSTEYRDILWDHLASLYVHSSKDKSQYTYHLHVDPHESFVTLQIPSRELAAILSVDLPKSKQSGAFKVEGSVYLDRKNRPTEKTSLLVSGDVNTGKGKNSLSLNGVAKFVYPNQPKDMLMDVRLLYGGESESGPTWLDANMNIDMFAKKSQKITISAKAGRQQLSKGYNMTGVLEIISRGQQLKVDLKNHLVISPNELGYGSIFSYTDEHQKPKSTGILFSANPSEIHLLITSPNKELMKYDVKIDASKNLQKVHEEFSILGNPSIVTSLEVQDMNSFKFQQYSEANPNDKLTANGRIVIGELAEAHADVYQNNAKKNLFHALIHLDEGKFLQPDFGYDKDVIIAVIEKTKEEMGRFAHQIKEISLDIVEEIKTETNDLIEHLKKAQPNLKSLSDYYQAELDKLKEELHADQTLKEMQTTLNKSFGHIIAAVMETMKQLTERVKDLSKQYEQIVSKLVDAVNAVYPQLKESFEKVFNAFAGVVNAISNVAITYLKAALNMINEHQKEIKELIAVVSEFLHDVAKLISRTYGQIKKDLEEFVQMLIDQAKALPVYEMAKEKYKDLMNFEIPENIIRPFEDICTAIKNMLPSPELREFFGTTYEYVMKLVRRQKVDDAAEIKKIYQRAIIAIKSLIHILETKGNLDYLPEMIDTKLPTDLDILTKLPGISTFKISVWNLIRNRELPTIFDVYSAYKPTRHISDIIPPFSKTGTVIDGGHFFTFDGRHFTMPGTCNYILAQDMRDGNFSVVANFNNGNLLSVTITEPKESITVKSNGNILVNNKPADFPASTKNLHAFLLQPVVHVKSDYGVHLKCINSAPMICTIRVSGYYLGKVRGLLGDGNNEPYDDFTLPNGKITENDSEFGNAYKLKPECAAAVAVDHKTPERVPACTEYFASSSSSMNMCFKHINPSPYRDACDYAAKKNSETACLIAGAYYSACFEDGVLGIKYPSSCVNCKVGEQNIAVGDAFSVKIPKKEADIIFVVEQDTQNEKVFKEMVMPLMADLREELKHQGINDVHIGLIGFGEKMEYPQHYTVNGNPNIEGEVKNMKFEESSPIVTLQEAKEGNNEKKLTFLQQRLNVELGTIKLTDAYEEAIHYPFRPGAAKAVVGVVASPCEKSLLPISIQHLRLILAQKIYRDFGLTYYHVSFPGDMLVSGKPQKTVVGYDRDSVFMFADNKKRPISGANADLRDNLSPSVSDVCADFAVTSGGATFTSNNFMDAKPNQKKQFAQIAARRIVEGLVSVEIEEDCTCEQYRGFSGRSDCTIVDRKEKTIARHTKDQGVKG